jgi:energy-coupling factor transporter ATP-binding protein EcfA2
MNNTATGFPGARFYKADLHIHTPASKCWSGVRDPSSLDLLFKRLKAQGLKVVSITDHNSIESIDKAKKLSEEFGIHVYPGVEVSTKEGHILAIFDPTKSTSEIEDWLIRIGFTKEFRGDETALARDQDGEPLSITRVFDLIENEGGVAIAPHPNSKGVGFLEILKQKGVARQQAYHSRNLRGLEVGSDKSKILKLASGSVTGYAKKYACVANSDAHSIDEVGDTFTYIKLGDFGIGALKQALYDPAMRIRFPDQWPLKAHAWIRGIEVSQGFFKGTNFLFHPDMNAVVGGKATGKSLLIELIRFVLESTSPIQSINEENKSKINAQTCLGAGGTVTLYVESENGEQYRIQRTVSDLDEGPEIFYGETQTKAAERVSDVFRCTTYSQNEIIELGRSLPALLDWLDSFIDLSKEREQAAEFEREMHTLLQELDGASTVALQEKEFAKRLQELRDREKLLNDKIKDPILKEYPQWQKELRLLKNFAKGLGHLHQKVEDFFVKIDWEEVFPESDAGTPNAVLITEKRKSLLGLELTFEKTKDDLQTKLLTEERKMKDFAASWEVKFSVAQQKHDKLIQDAGVENASALTSELDKVTAQIEHLDREFKKARKAATRKSEIEGKLRNTLIPKYNSCFIDIYKKRVAKADTLTHALDSFVRISVRQMADRSAFADAVVAIARGSGLRKPDIDAVVVSMTPLELTKYLAAKDFAGLAKHAGIQIQHAQTFLEHVWDRNTDEEGHQLLSPLYGIMFTELQDQVIVELKVGDDAYKPMQELSVGSKCTAILSVALVEGTYPLIVDQPEDALDNTFVFDQIVRIVRRSKEDRQFLFATHNPNVAVASDADLIYCLKATASRGDVDKHGSIDQISTRDRVIANLEGGRDAFALRSQKYDIVIEDPHAVVLDVAKEH